MPFLLDLPFLDHRDPNYFAENRARGLAYRNYLESVRDQLPLSVYRFATAEWRQNITDPRGLHDAELVSLSIDSSDTQDGIETSIKLALEGRNGDRVIRLAYGHVSRYLLNASDGHGDLGRTTVGGGHGALVVDEISVSSEGHAQHHLIFGSGARWLLEFRSFLWEVETR